MPPNKIFINDVSGLSDLPDGRAKPIFRPLADEYANAGGTNAHGLDNETRINGHDDSHGIELGAGDPLETLTEHPYNGSNAPLDVVIPPVPIPVVIVPQPMKAVRRQTIISTLLAEDLLISSTVLAGTVDMGNRVGIAADRRRTSVKLWLSAVVAKAGQTVGANWAVAVSTDSGFQSFMVMNLATGGAPVTLEFEGIQSINVAPYALVNGIGTGTNNFRLNSLYYLEDMPLDKTRH